MSRMPVAAGDIREIAGQPVFVPLYKLFLAYGEMFILAIGPKKFVVVSDNDVAKRSGEQQVKGAVELKGSPRGGLCGDSLHLLRHTFRGHRNNGEAVVVEPHQDDRATRIGIDGTQPQRMALQAVRFDGLASSSGVDGALADVAGPEGRRFELRR